MHDQQMISRFANTRDTFKRCPTTLAAGQKNSSG